MKPSSDDIRNRVVRDLFAEPLMDNALRGYWCEAMVAEALGPTCRLVGQGWYPWDLEIGDPRGCFPQRLRIQVKNSARAQPWNRVSGEISDTMFSLTWRRKPAYFERDNPGIECEDEGFMCEVYILCHHPVEDYAIADHRDPTQWEFFVLPVVARSKAVSETELAALRKRLSSVGRAASTQRRPETLKRGIRGREPIVPVGIHELTTNAVWEAVARFG